MHLNGTEALMNRTSYYEALRSVDPRTQDVTEWLEYFAGDRCGDGAGRVWHLIARFFARWLPDYVDKRLEM